MFSIIAIQERKGEYQGHSYHFFNVYVSSTGASSSWTDGVFVDKFKVPAQIFQRCELRIGSSCNFVFDRFGKVCDVHVV